MVDVSWSVDSWAEVDEEEYCYKCADFVIPDKGGHCPDCLEYIAYGSEFNTSSTATTTVADAPAISSDGDMWGRSRRVESCDPTETQGRSELRFGDRG